MLWDRILFDRLIKDGKKLVVDKTPANALGWRRIHNYWPDAKFIILYRHPVRILGSWSDARPDISTEKSIPQLLKFTQAMEQAHAEHGGLIVKYEDLTRDPARTTQQICRFLGVPWEPQMIEYGQQDHGRVRPRARRLEREDQLRQDLAGAAGPEARGRPGRAQGDLPADGLPVAVPGPTGALRTPDDRFVGLPDFAYDPHYVDLSDGLRMAWVEAGPADGAAGAAAARRAVLVVPVPVDAAGARRRRACARSRQT